MKFLEEVALIPEKKTRFNYFCLNSSNFVSPMDYCVIENFTVVIPQFLFFSKKKTQFLI